MLADNDNSPDVNQSPQRLPAENAAPGESEFEWDSSKAEANRKKHGVTFEEAKDIFYDPMQASFDDPAHSLGEKRAIIMGHSKKGRLLIVVFADRGSRVRLISARQATRRERKDYEKK